jgi:hypothetical protein
MSLPNNVVTFKFETEVRPITIYLCKERKPILVFKAGRVAEGYLFDNLSKRRVYDCLYKKSTNKTNFFKEEIAFRYSTQSQIDLLGEELYLVLDERFRRTKFVTSLISKMV